MGKIEFNNSGSNVNFELNNVVENTSDEVSNRKIKVLRRVFYIPLAAIVITGGVYGVARYQQSEARTFKTLYKDSFNTHHLRDDVENYAHHLSLMNEAERQDNLAMLDVFSLIERKDFYRAIDKLETLKGEDKEFLKALCLLKVKNDTKAFTAFSEIAERDGEFSVQARKVLNKHYCNCK